MEGRPTLAGKRWFAHAGHGVAAPHLGANRRRRARTLGADGWVTLDGSDGEGGGQILRTALSLSLLTGRPFRITQIRANRDRPGLRPQHLAAVESAALLADADVRGASVGSRELSFRPSAYEPSDLLYDIGTAGATALVLQTLHLPLALRAATSIRVTLAGGTFNTSAPSFPFLATTWRDYLAVLGLPVALSMPRAGFYPVGEGELDVWVEPGEPQPLMLVERPPLERITGVVGIAHLERNRIAERMIETAEAALAEEGFRAEFNCITLPAASPGVAISFTAQHGRIGTTFLGLGVRGKPAETVAAEAVEELLAFERAAGAVDPHSADQLLLPLAFAPGKSEYTVSSTTEHLRTNARTIGAFLDRAIRIEPEKDDGTDRVVVS